jgi:agmatinase
MARYGPQFGPDITFLGVPRCTWDEPETYADADVVILGAPFDGGTSYRSGARFGPQYVRQTCYLPHDGSRPSLALRVDGLSGDLTVYDAGDVEMYAGDAERSVRDLQAAVAAVARTGAIPLIIGATTPSRGRTRRAWPSTSARAGCRWSTSTRTPTPATSSSAR